MPSQRQLARQLGLSPATVSRALSGAPEVDPHTRARVLSAALGCGMDRPLQAAGGRTLVTLMPDARAIGDVFYAREAIRGMGRAAGALACRLLVHRCSPTDAALLARDPGVLPAGLPRQPDGLVLWGWREAAPLAALATRWPTVVLGSVPPQAESQMAVAVDALAGCRLLVERLFAAGHRRIGMVVGAHQDGRGSERLGALAAALDERQATLANADVVHWLGAPSPAWRRRIASGTTAWVVDSHVLGYAVLTALAQHGVAVPEMVSLAAFTAGPPPTGVPRLSAVVPAFAAMGRAAVRMLLAPRDPLIPPSRLLIAPRWDEGFTLGPPPA